MMQTAVVNQMVMSTGFGVPPFFIAGMIDGVNPMAIIGIILFILSLVSFRSELSKFVLAGVAFVIVLLGLTFCTIVGFWDSTTVRFPLLFKLVELVSFFLGIFFIVLGVLDFYDWCVSVRSGSLKRCVLKWGYTSIWQEEGAGPGPWKFIASFNKWQSFIFGCFCAVFVSALNALWAPHENVAYIYYTLGQPGQEKQGMQLIILYSLAYVIPLVVLLAGLFIAFRNYADALLNARVVLRIKIISSAVFLSFGIGVVFVVLYKNFY